jgi:hypothetical protein
VNLTECFSLPPGDRSAHSAPLGRGERGQVRDQDRQTHRHARGACECFERVIILIGNVFLLLYFTPFLFISSYSYIFLPFFPPSRKLVVSLPRSPPRSWSSAFCRSSPPSRESVAMTRHSLWCSRRLVDWRLVCLFQYSYAWWWLASHKNLVNISICMCLLVSFLIVLSFLLSISFSVLRARPPQDPRGHQDLRELLNKRNTGV